MVWQGVWTGRGNRVCFICVLGFHGKRMAVETLTSQQLYALARLQKIETRKGAFLFNLFVQPYLK